MPTRLFAVVAGSFYALLGILGLIPAFLWFPDDRLRFYDVHVIAHYGFLFGWMPTNLIHNLLYIAVGGAGVLAALSFTSATWFSRGLLVLTANLTLLGLMPFGIDHLWGLMPLFSWNLMVHVVTATLAYYYGFIYPLDRGGYFLTADDPDVLAATGVGSGVVMNA